MVVEVRNETHAPHLVALVKVPGDGWHLFNDFVVQSISEDEALSFIGTWKVRIASLYTILMVHGFDDARFQTPCVLYLERVDNASSLDFSMLPMKMDPAILCTVDNISWYVYHCLSGVCCLSSFNLVVSRRMNKSKLAHEPLTVEELPKPGTLVSIDAEFVSLQKAS